MGYLPNVLAHDRLEAAAAAALGAGIAHEDPHKPGPASASLRAIAARAFATL